MVMGNVSGFEIKQNVMKMISVFSVVGMVICTMQEKYRILVIIHNFEITSEKIEKISRM